MNTNFDNLVSIYDFRDPGDFIYNSDLVTFTEFGAQLKNLIPDNVALGATYWKSTDANYGNGDIALSAILTGNVNIQGHKAAFIGGQFPKLLEYYLTNLDTFANLIPSGSITFQYYPNYSGTPKNTQYIFHWGIGDSDNEDILNEETGQLEEAYSKKNCMEIVHTVTGDILFNIYDRASNLYQAKKDSVIIEEAVRPFEFKFLWDYITTFDNETRVKLYLYFEGLLIDSFDFDSETFNLSDIVNLGFGQSDPDKPFPNFYISNLLVEKLPENFDKDIYCPEIYSTRGYIPMFETRYTTVPQKIETVGHITLEALQHIDVLVNESTMLDNYRQYVGYTFKLGETEYFFDRTTLTWKEHIYPEDISDLAHMLAYKNDLINEGVSFKCIPYLRSVDGKGTPQITTLTITYNEYVPCTETHPVALIYGYVRDVLGNPICNAKVLITPSKSSVAYSGNYILPKMTKVIRTGQNGYWDAELALSDIFDPEILYNIQIIIRDQVVYQRANIRVNREGTIKFDDLVEENNRDCCY